MLDIVSTGRRASGFSRRGKKQRWTAAAVCLALVAGLAACGTSAQTGSQSTPDRSAEPPADVTPPQLLGLADMTVAMGETVYIARKKKRWEHNARHHVARAGETAYAIGQSYAIRTRSIEKMNRLKPGVEIEQGRQIRIK